MQPEVSADRPDSPDERRQQRRARRWKRRARMAGPFLGVALLMATLSLSVDLIEYKPEPPKPEKLSDRPLPRHVLERQREREAESAEARPATVSGPSLIAGEPLIAEQLGGAGMDRRGGSASLDLELAPSRIGGEMDTMRDLASPKAPFALRGR